MKPPRLMQPKIPGMQRIPGSASLHPTLDQMVREEARLYGVSRSYVRAQALIEFFDRRYGKRVAQQAYWERRPGVRVVSFLGGRHGRRQRAS